MALRWSRAASGLLLAATLLGVVRAQGSGSHDHTGQTPNLAVLGVIETREPDSVESRALAAISYPWRERLPGWEVRFLPQRPGLRGLTLPSEKRIEIYVRDTDTPESLARVVAHEMGHAADLQLNDSRDRDRWRRARGAGAEVPWWPDDSASDFATLGGDFAEAFAVWQTGAQSRSTVAGQPAPDQLAVLVALVS